jgi:peptidoglycan/LPS O-acetylase OafA/YrhL
MPAALSIYLDFVRFGAAFFVLISHAGPDEYGGAWLRSVSAFGHDAVIVFFVLSGFVIAHTVETKERSVNIYLVSRLARLWSVAVPAIVLTFLLAWIGGAAPAANTALVQGAVSVVFANQIWFFDANPVWNDPYWSLGYEFPYYVFFAIISFAPRRWRCALVALWLASIGPRVTVLLPIWLFGVWLYRAHSRVRTPEIAGWVLALMPVPLLLALYWSGTAHYLQHLVRDEIGVEAAHFLRFSEPIARQYVIGILVTVHFWGITVVAHRLDRPLRIAARSIRYLANHTLSLYLFHMPLLSFGAAMLHPRPNDPLKSATMIVATTVVVALLAPFTEGRKNEWRLGLLWAAAKVRRTLAPAL